MGGQPCISVRLLQVTDSTAVRGERATGLGCRRSSRAARVRASYQVVDGHPKALVIDATSKASGQ